MIPQLDNKIMSSLLLYLDHEIQDKGQAYQNEVLTFYPVNSPYANTYVYACNQKPLCNDISISGANILSGVYLNQTFVQVGTSGLAAINHYKGAIYFTGTNPSNVVISGQVAVKEINIKITNQPDYKLLFETQYLSDSSNPASSQVTGLPLDTEVTPIVFIMRRKQENKPFGFSRLDNQTIGIRTISVVDNEYQEIALTTILKNLNYRTVPLFTSTPFNSVGDMTGINYDFSQLPIDSSLTPIILGVKAIDLPITDGVKNVLRNMAIVDFEISTINRS